MATKTDPDKPAAFSSYLRPSMQERLRRAAHEERKTVQVILEECVSCKFPVISDGKGAFHPSRRKGKA